MSGTKAKPGTPYTNEERACIRERWHAGDTIQQIAAVLGRSPDSVDHQRTQMPDLENRVAAQCAQREELIKQIIALRLEGLGRRGIMERLGVSRHAYDRAAKRLGPAHRAVPEPRQQSIERWSYGDDPLPAMHPITWGAIQTSRERHGVD